MVLLLKLLDIFLSVLRFSSKCQESKFVVLLMCWLLFYSILRNNQKSTIFHFISSCITNLFCNYCLSKTQTLANTFVLVLHVWQGVYCCQEQLMYVGMVFLIFFLMSQFHYEIFIGWGGRAVCLGRIVKCYKYESLDEYMFVTLCKFEVQICSLYIYACSP